FMEKPVCVDAFGAQICLAAAKMDAPVRSVYLPVLRDHVEEMLDVFDFAEPAFVSGDRDETSVPTQALFMMNSAAVTDPAWAQPSGSFLRSATSPSSASS
ncbi:MAG: DUF1553 domain-containing protein, partial [Caulobacteraceae bacterium]|nr:DUF1553 domain-containing protein [Caulobacteraceae bacterium]